MSPVTKSFAFYVVILILLAFIWPFLPVLPVGYIPGDVVSKVGGITLYLAFGTALVLDLILIFLLYLFQRL
ncbi:MAG: DUF2905 family protein [Alphaproteobacteria bacterium]